eukprot:c18446_g1_i1.p1 GENE.c18446_g1_i1~~c18446_g1_i1.p1  ORF type:complete len:154 (-),score=42.36 c18446_g1_i1:19-480(-)
MDIRDKFLEHELDLILMFRSDIEDEDVPSEQKDDGTCVRFLRARNHNLTAAQKMWRKSMEWRKAYGVDEMIRRRNAILEGKLEKSPEYRLLEKYASGVIAGVDKDGVVVEWERIGICDLNGLLREVGPDNVLSWMVLVTEEQQISYRKVYNIY